MIGCHRQYEGRLHLAWTLILLVTAGPLGADEPDMNYITRPLPPEYQIHPDRSVTLRICFNWSCARQETLTFSAEEMAGVAQQMELCPTEPLADRIQRLRIGIWQMELVAQRYLPVLMNDREINDFDSDMDGRLDCVDNATNTTTYLNILSDLALLGGWTPAEPRVRNPLDFGSVHWTAVVENPGDRAPWSVDSWFRPHGHLPYLMPLAPWLENKKGWEPPFSDLNPYPKYVNEICTPPTVAEMPLF